MSARSVDRNGFITISRNPISRVGVFPYLGANLPGAADPNKVYNVYRPAETLQDPACIASFQQVPLIDDHTMIGSTEMGFTPAEKKGIHGITGSRVDFENNILYSDLKIFSESLADKIDDNKIGLSLGYLCEYEYAPGVFNGQFYDFVQRSMRGNHIALVDEPRCNVYVLDGKSITFDSLDLSTHKKENQDMLTPEQIKTRLDTQDAALAKITSGMDALVKATTDAAEKAAKDAEENEKEEAAAKAAADKKAKDELEYDPESEMDSKKAMDALTKVTGALDAAVKKIDTLTSEVTALKTGAPKAAMDAISKRDALAAKLTPFIGAFDASDKTVQEVAEYGVKKLGVACDAGQEISALTGFLHGRKADVDNIVHISGEDGVKKSSKINDYKSGKA